METAVVGMQSRILSTHEKIVVDSSLQEGSPNIDAQTLSSERGRIAPCRIGELNTAQLLSTAFDPRFNAGNRSSKENVYGRMDRFVQHLFGASEHGSYAPPFNAELGNAGLQEVIVVGHSCYFRSFFRRFLQPSSNHIAKERKLKNCGVISFDLVRNESTGEIYIEESSIRVLYKGF
uniref:Uncharacterized protein TCIL3000_9_3530 n=1 Tax=Trypanosoma congolense (strain IL3000) TaxID=1068625 RepID=G0UU92_TRYCI|nr:unnamed protein product [Trypanosoma congolense IL3000]